jgi:hypothetical protein
MRAHSRLEVEHIVSGLHFVQEDNGPAIGFAIAEWPQCHGLAASNVGTTKDKP